MKEESTIEIMREEQSHGRAWNTMHGGYFASLKIAEPFVDEIIRIFHIARPDVIVDLGGGTGFLLDQVRYALTEPVKPGFLVIDLSIEQLNAAADLGLRGKQDSITEFSRKSLLQNENAPVMYISRSTFHYAGKNGLLPLLEHIAGEMKSGEFFVHQTACFADCEDQQIMNRIYEMMNTEKWYPAVSELTTALESAGLEVLDVKPAAPLPLTSESLAARYKVPEELMVEICNAIPVKKGVTRKTRTDFTAYLHYRIYICRKK